jgi:hypothetical protein
VEINNGGTVVGRGGELKKTGAGIAKAATYSTVDGKKQLTDKASLATAINDVGQVSGAIYSGSFSADNPDSAFIYDPVAKFWSITNLLQDTSQDIAFWTSKDKFGGHQGPNVQAISEPLIAGGFPLIVGDKLTPGSMFPDGNESRLGFILRPIGGTASALSAGSVPEPTSFLLLTIGLLPPLVARQRRSVE